MKIYHGTAERHLGSILKNGIEPRALTKNSNWKKYRSRTDMVYLTTAYSIFFAFNTVRDGEKLVVVEVDFEKLDKDQLYPDEDVVAQAMSRQMGKSLDDVHPIARANLEANKSKWDASLRAMGTVAHSGTVPLGAITRYALIDRKKRADFIFSAIDTTISLMAFQFMGQFYLDTTLWLMGDRAELPHVGTARTEKTLFEAKKGDKAFDEMAVACDKRVAFWSAESARREGIDVVNVTGVAKRSKERSKERMKA